MLCRIKDYCAVLFIKLSWVACYDIVHQWPAATQSSVLGFWSVNVRCGRVNSSVLSLLYLGFCFHVQLQTWEISNFSSASCPYMSCIADFLYVFVSHEILQHGARYFLMIYARQGNSWLTYSVPLKNSCLLNVMKMHLRFDPMASVRSITFTKQAYYKILSSFVCSLVYLLGTCAG